jgi:RHS repeat-associated protein
MFRIVGAELARGVLKSIVLSMAILSPLAATASAQSVASPTDSTTPLGLERGAPAGAFELSGFESVNPYNGNLNFHLPLLHIGGRGGAQTTMMLALNTKSWRVLHTIHNPGSQNPTDVYAPVQDTWWQLDTGYGPGVMEGRHSGYRLLSPSCAPSQTTNPVYQYTVTQLTFRASDGTEYQFRDQLTGGQPALVDGNTCAQIARNHGQAGASRGTVWVSTGGEAMTFVSDTAISDHALIIGTAADHEYPSGLLMMRDGTQYRIDSGLVSWIRDRNGNSISFQYDQNFKRVTSITSSLGTTASVDYDYNDSQFGICDRINYSGFGGAPRIIRVFKTALENALRADQTQGIQYPAQLFPPDEGMTGATSQTRFTTSVVMRVLLPDGLRSYNLRYNVYAELARVILPTGGMIDYDMTPGSGTLNQGGCPVPGTDLTCNPVQIYRRVAKRTVYPNGLSTTAEGSTTFAASEVGDTQMTYRTTATIMHYDGQTILAKDVHIFSGSPSASLFVTSSGNFYPAWGEGKEIQTDSYDPTRGKLESAASLFVQRTPAPTTWWWMPWLPGMPADSTGEPPQDPRLASTTTTLVDSSEVSSTTYQYDHFSNVTDKYEYDFGGALLRHTHTQYVTSNNGTSYTDPTVGVHLRSLPSLVQVSDNLGLIAETDYEYDNYITDANQNHAPLVSRASMTGGDTALLHVTTPRSTTAYSTRGNTTKVTRQVLQDGTSRTSYAQYDIAGNVVLSIDPNGGKTSFDFADKFGSPSGSVTGTTTPTELTGGNSTFAFPSGVTNVSFNFTSYAKYDYHTGHPVDAQDINGVDSSASYAGDPLDRQTSVTRGANQGASLQSSTMFIYDDANRTITTKSDRDTLGDGLLKSQLVYDGMGRTTESRQYETPASYITTTRSYDGMGRANSVSNPYRLAETAVSTTTQYDGLSRATTVTTPDNAIVQTEYNGSRVLVTDQAGKQRISKSDGLGRLTDVWEITAADSATESVMFPNHPDITAGYRTSYIYDALDDLTKATQQIGPTTGTKQTRTFLYDSLKELTDATNPESGHVQYTYDNNGNLLTKLDARSIMTHYVYDAMNRLTSRSYTIEPQHTPEGTPPVNLYYDQNLPQGSPPSFVRGSSLGRLVATTYGGTSAGSYTGYDPLGRPNVSYQRTDSQNYGFSYGYNVAGEMTSETYPSGKVVQMDYDAAGRLSGVKNQASGLYYAGGAGTDVLNQIQYASHGAVSAMKLGNGKWEHSTFNSRLQPTQIGLGASSADSSVLKLDYDYGTTSDNGNVLTQTISIGLTVMSQSYFYDALNRLSSATETFNSALQWQQNFDYDRFGNRAVRNTSYFPSPRQTPISSSPSDLSFLYNQTNNRITATSEYQYDPSGSGNLTSMPNMFSGADTMTYDAENRQKTNTPAGGGATNYTYDGDGRRVKKVVPGNPATTTVFVYNVAGQLIAEYTSDPVPPAQGGGGTSYLTSDPLGSTRVVTKFDGTVKARYDYLPFGEELGAGVGQRTVPIGYSAADSIRQKFTQKERDTESGLDYFLARYYSSSHGRFTSPDEFASGPEDLFEFADQASVNPTFYADLHEPQSLNKYQYCYNNPLCYIDPDGHQSLTERLKQAAKATVSAAVEVGKGTLKGAVASASFGLFPGTEPSSNDSLLDRAGQVIGTAIVSEVSTDVAAGSGLITVFSGGATSEVTVPSAIAGVAGVAGSLVNAEKLITTPIHQKSGGPKAEEASGVSAGGQATDQHGNKLGPSGEPMVHNNSSTTREAARNKTLNQGSRAVEHRNPRRGESHFHPADGEGKKKPSSAHYNYKKKG